MLGESSHVLIATGLDGKKVVYLYRYVLRVLEIGDMLTTYMQCVFSRIFLPSELHLYPRVQDPWSPFAGDPIALSFLVGCHGVYPGLIFFFLVGTMWVKPS